MIADRTTVADQLRAMLEEMKTLARKADLTVDIVDRFGVRCLRLTEDEPTLHIAIPARVL